MTYKVPHTKKPPMPVEVNTGDPLVDFGAQTLGGVSLSTGRIITEAFHESIHAVLRDVTKSHRDDVHRVVQGLGAISKIAKSSHGKTLTEGMGELKTRWKEMAAEGTISSMVQVVKLLSKAQEAVSLVYIESDSKQDKKKCEDILYKIQSIKSVVGDEVLRAAHKTLTETLPRNVTHIQSEFALRKLHAAIDSIGKSKSYPSYTTLCEQLEILGREKDIRPVHAVIKDTLTALRAFKRDLYESLDNEYVPYKISGLRMS